MCPDYEIIEWNESSFDIHSCRYAEQAYQAKKWAFVSDYARFVIINNHGGIYLDTDIELLKSFDDLLKFDAVFGFATDKGLTVPFFAAQKDSPCLDRIIDSYHQKLFVKSDGSYDTTAIEKTVETVLTKQFGLILNDEYQLLKGNIAIFPHQYFYARNYLTGVVNKYPELYLIHYGDGTWLDESQKELLQMQHKAVKRYGPRLGVKVGKLKYYLRKEGFFMTAKRICKSMKG